MDPSGARSIVSARLVEILIRRAGIGPTVGSVTVLWNLAVVGAAGGLVLFALVLLPACLHQRRRFGRVRPWRLLAWAAVSVYTMCLVVLTILPAYDVAVTCRHRIGGKVQLDPFRTAEQLWGLWRSGESLLAIAVSFPSLQMAANVVLFVPLGLILSGLLRWDALSSLVAGMFLSVLIEVTQFTGAWGVYPCGVRIADVEDVVANMLGAGLGAVLAAAVLSWPWARGIVRR